MFDLDKWEEIYETVKKHKLRTFLTAFGVYWGIFMLVILMGAGTALQNGVEYQFRDDAVNSIWVRPGTASKPYKGLPMGRRTQLTNTDLNRTKQDIKGVEYITARFYLPTEFTVTYKEKSASFNCRAVNPDHQITENTTVTKGRYINDRDLDQKRKVCVIGKLVAEKLFDKEEEPIGKFIGLKGINYRVVGVFEDTGGDGEMMMIYLPLYTAQLAYNGDDKINQLIFTTGDATVPESKVMEAKLRKDLSIRHNFDVDDKEAVYIRNNVEQFAQFLSLFFWIKAFVWFVGVGSILAGIIGVSNIMLITVKERTKEIGIRKALGATPVSIVSMIVQESFVITAFSGYMGLLVSVGILNFIDYLMVSKGLELGFFRSPQIDFGVAISAVVLLSVAGVMAGLFPAMRAAKVNPVVAMRED